MTGKIIRWVKQYLHPWVLLSGFGLLINPTIIYASDTFAPRSGYDDHPGLLQSNTPGMTTRVSVSSSDAQTNGYSAVPFISADGRYVTFYSDARNLVTGDTNGDIDVFVHDRDTKQTTRVSVSSSGEQGNNASMEPVISADGRYVAFRSVSSNLVVGDTNGRDDIFVHDRVTGQTTRVSVSSSGEQVNNSTVAASISGDGRYIAFQSLANNLVANDTNNAYDIFIHDRTTGQTTRVSVNSSGQQGNFDSYKHIQSLSDDGRYITFWSSASNLVTGDTNAKLDVFVHDQVTGQTILASVNTSGQQGNLGSDLPSISGDGRYVAFASYANNLTTGDTNISRDIFVRDLIAGVTRRVSVSSSGVQANNLSYRSSISTNGRYVAFESSASNLVTGDNNVKDDIFVHDTMTEQTTRVSVSSNGEEGDRQSWNASISGDGRYIAFESWAGNLIDTDYNATADIFVHDQWPFLTSLPNAAPLRNGYNTLTPLLTWSGISWATGYELQISDVPTFNQIIYSKTLPIEARSDQATLPGEGTYYWRVRARQANDNWGIWNSPDSFVIKLTG
jgi:WD40-like Beta Propeller Repeat